MQPCGESNRSKLPDRITKEITQTGVAHQCANLINTGRNCQICLFHHLTAISSAQEYFLTMRFSLTAAFVGAAALMSSVSADFYNRLNVDDAAFLFVDHQTGLLNLVQDYNPDTYLNNVMGLAESAKYFKVCQIMRLYSSLSLPLPLLTSSSI